MSDLSRCGWQIGTRKEGACLELAVAIDNEKDTFGKVKKRGICLFHKKELERIRNKKA